MAHTLKPYIIPKIKVKEVHIQSYMQTGGSRIEYGEGDGPGGSDSRGRRGTWGNLWYDGED